MARFVLLLLATCLAGALGKRKRVVEDQNGVAPGAKLSVKERVNAVENRGFAGISGPLEYKNSIAGYVLEADGVLEEEEEPESFVANEIVGNKMVTYNADVGASQTQLRDAFAKRAVLKNRGGEEVMAMLCGRCCCDMPSMLSFTHDKKVKRSDRCSIFYFGIASDDQFAKVKCGMLARPDWSSPKGMHNFQQTFSFKDKRDVSGQRVAGKCMVPQAEIDKMDSLIALMDEQVGPAKGVGKRVDRCERKFHMTHGGGP